MTTNLTPCLKSPPQAHYSQQHQTNHKRTIFNTDFSSESAILQSLLLYSHSTTKYWHIEGMLQCSHCLILSAAHLSRVRVRVTVNPNPAHLSTYNRSHSTKTTDTGMHGSMVTAIDEGNVEEQTLLHKSTALKNVDYGILYHSA